jgi:tetratricopeptide (TPR) repeat protein
MKNKILFSVLIISLFSFNLYSQNSSILFDQNNKKYASVNVLKTYERVAEKGYKSIDLFKKLGIGHYTNSEFTKAAKWYGELFAMTSDLESECYYQYAQSLVAIGNNDKANEIIEKLKQRLKKNSDTKK